MSKETGILVVKNETQTFGSNGFRKREAVLKTNSQYPQEILFEFIQDKCDLLDAFKVGDSIAISYNLNGRKWTNPEGVDKYFVSIQGWRIEKDDTTAEGNFETQAAPAASSAPDPLDLPF